MCTYVQKIFPLLPRVFPPNEVNSSVLRVRFKIFSADDFLQGSYPFPWYENRINILNFIKASNEKILIKEFRMRKDDFWQLWQLDIWVFSHDDPFCTLFESLNFLKLFTSSFILEMSCLFSLFPGKGTLQTPSSWRCSDPSFYLRNSIDDFGSKKVFRW